jgi:hypothetical protein
MNQVSTIRLHLMRGMYALIAFAMGSGISGGHFSIMGRGTAGMASAWPCWPPWRQSRYLGFGIR